MRQLPQHIIFDLDGTLVDSAPVICAVVNEMLAERGDDRLIDVDKVRPWLSWGGPALISAALRVEGDKAAAELAEFRRRYAERHTPDECVFDGVREGLRKLASLGCTLSICSNKPQYLCEKVLDDVGLSHHFTLIVGSIPELRQKPAPDLMSLVLRTLHARPSRSVLVGDSDVDHATALATGVPFRFMSYGYAPEDWDTSGLVQFSRFADLVSSLTIGEATGLPLREAA